MVNIEILAFKHILERSYFEDQYRLMCLGNCWSSSQCVVLSQLEATLTCEIIYKRRSLFIHRCFFFSSKKRASGHYQVSYISFVIVSAYIRIQGR